MRNGRRQRGNVTAQRESASELAMTQRGDGEYSKASVGKEWR
jgi:hypothetical protein